MSGKTPTKPPAAGKPFLGDDDLVAELDAWDATFDALHETGAEPAPAATPSTAWKDPDQLATQPAARPALQSADTIDDLATRAVTGTEELDDAETDFSDVGARGGPAALGELLGRPPSAPVFADDADATIAGISIEGVLPALDDEDDEVEEEILTSASRPRGSLTSPPPIATQAQPAVRRPAIIRRTASTPTVAPPPGTQASDEAAARVESTRVASIAELEARRNAARQDVDEPRSKTPTIQPPPPSEDDYADIEMVADDAKPARSAAPVAPVQPGASSGVRRTAHVLRRADHATRPPPAAPPALRPTGDSGPTRRGDEDDFSDVAISVGATDDLPLLDDRAPSPRDVAGRTATTTAPPPLGGARSRAIPAAPIAQERSEPVGVDDVLAELDAEPGSSSPTIVDNPIAPPAGSTRPPALVDVYRSKPPTSIPPLDHTRQGATSGLAAGQAPARTLMGMSPVAAVVPKRASTAIPEYIPEDIADIEPALDLDRLALPEQVAPLAATALDEDSAASLAVYEREIATVDESETSAALRIEAGRLAERLGEIERARAHYDAALLADPRATPALRGLRRIARSTGDLAEATRQLDAEIAIAGALERRPLGHYRVDLLMASGEQDMARVAVGEILDTTPSDVRALLAQLELAFLDGRADEFGTALEQLAHAVVDSELRAAVHVARAALAAHHNDGGAAASWFSAAAESDPAAIGARLGAIRNAARQADGDAASRALVDLARTLEATDPTTAAALAVRARQWAPTASPTAATATAIATAAAAGDAIVARLAAEHAVAANDPGTAGAAFALWAASSAVPAERAYAAARAAELIPGRGAELWSLALEIGKDHDGDDYAAAQLRTSYVALVTEDAPPSVRDEAMRKAIDVDLAICNAGVERDRARLRAAFSLIGENQLDAAIDLLANGRAARPRSLAIAEALGEALANAQRWSDRAQLFAELADEPGDQLDPEVAQLRSAIAWEEAVGAAAADAATQARTEQSVAATTASALTAWNRVLEQASGSPAAHASAIVLASRLGDRDVLAEVLARAQATERSPWAVASLALRRARLYAVDEPQRSDAILRELGDQPPTAELDDPRRTALVVVAAARQKDPSDAAQALEDRAARIAAAGVSAPEAAALRLRAAQLALDAGDAGKATALLGQVERALPSLGVVPDLLAAARRRAGDRSSTGSATPHATAAPAPGAGGDAYARLLRDADLAAAQDDAQAALALYQRALEQRPDDPLAIVPLVRVATQLRDGAALTQLALGRLRAAEAANDHVAKAEAYELLAHIDADLRDDGASAQIALENASQADPSRIDLIHRLERRYAKTDRLDELIRLRRSVVGNLPAGVPHDRAALTVDLAALAARDQRTDAELAELYRSALADEPRHRLALFHLESLVRRHGASPELADLEGQIAEFFGSGTSANDNADRRGEAAFHTRAGETLAEIGRIPEAIDQFKRAVAALPGHAFALEGWRAAALKGERWVDVADAATQQAEVTVDAGARGALHHLAGVALMDKALDGERAAAAFRRALEANPRNADAFIRLRILLEEDGNHDDLATLLAQRLEVEPDARGKIELHRALAELHRNFLSDRDTAKRHYRAILAADPNDLRAHAAVADIAWEQGSWEEAADALVARARLEREPEVLKTLCYRLGLIYADRLVNVPKAIAAFQRALTFTPDDENTLVRLADLATSAGEWKLALGACERLVKAEQDPERRAAHLQRVAKIFKNGFNDAKRAERALNLALDSAPTSDDALSALVAFYKDAGDMVSVRVHLNRVAGAMRARYDKDSKDGVACRVISRAMAARDHAGVVGSLAVARAAAELADLLGAAGEPERLLLTNADLARAEPSRLIKPETDEVLFPRGMSTELRQMFQLLGDRMAKHVGVDLRPYGATRGDRLRSRDSDVAATAQDIATQLGFGEIDVYVSTRQPFAMVAEPTSPVSFVVGQQVAAAGKVAVRFAAGAALKLAQASLAIPARLAATEAGTEELGVLVVALLRLFQPDFPAMSVDADAVTAQAHKLKRLIPTGLSNELRPFALAIDGQRFGHRELARDLRIAGLRAGLVASGSLSAGLGILAAQAGIGELPQVLSDPAAVGLIAFALGEDHATVAR